MIIFVKKQEMIKVGLTGNYYSGYNEVSDMFEEMGVPVFDADLAIKFMVNYSNKYTKRIENKFGKDIYYVGLIDLKKLDTDGMDGLLDILQLDLIKMYEKWRIRHWNSIYTIFKCSVLFERKLNESMNFTISTLRPSNLRKNDLLDETDLPVSKIEEILFGEMDELVKSKKANYTIHNYGSADTSYKHRQESLTIQINNINKALLKRGTPDYHEHNRTESYKNIMM
jgi:dephospho-CoA kinase